MGDNISRQSALDALRAIRSGLWEIDIPSPAGCPEYVEHHEQIQHMMGVVDGWIKKISEEESTDRKGHWIKTTHTYETIYVCSECCYAEGDMPKRDFCPSCGADMRGVDDESTL